jgi:hypothetical protein
VPPSEEALGRVRLGVDVKAADTESIGSTKPVEARARAGTSRPQLVVAGHESTATPQDGNGNGERAERVRRTVRTLEILIHRIRLRIRDEQVFAEQRDLAAEVLARVPPFAFAGRTAIDGGMRFPRYTCRSTGSKIKPFA